MPAEGVVDGTAAGPARRGNASEFVSLVGGRAASFQTALIDPLHGLTGSQVLAGVRIR